MAAHSASKSFVDRHAVGVDAAADLRRVAGKVARALNFTMGVGDATAFMCRSRVTVGADAAADLRRVAGVLNFALSVRDDAAFMCRS